MANWKNCKYCGQLYDRDADKQILSFLFLGFNGLERTYYCCENHFEIHTGKSIKSRKSNLFRVLRRILLIIVVLFALLIIIAKCTKTEQNKSQSIEGGSQPAPYSDSIQKNTKGKKKASVIKPSAAVDASSQKDELHERKEDENISNKQSLAADVTEDTSSPRGNPSSEHFEDPRDNQKYRIVVIGDQTWFAENLRYSTTSSSPDIKGVCFNNAKSCEKNGRLYSWEEATKEKLCPEGWHIPNRQDWGKLLKHEDAVSINSKIFNVKPVGYLDYLNTFERGLRFWSISGNCAIDLGGLGLYFTSHYSETEQASKYSIRCLRD
jgi:hypothetical protein